MAKTTEIVRLNSKIESLLAPLEQDDRRRILWKELKKTLSNDFTSINWLLNEVGNFLDKEGKNLLPVSNPKSKSQNHKSIST